LELHGVAAELPTAERPLERRVLSQLRDEGLAGERAAERRPAQHAGRVDDVVPRRTLSDTRCPGQVPNAGGQLARHPTHRKGRCRRRSLGCRDDLDGMTALAEEA